MDAVSRALIAYWKILENYVGSISVDPTVARISIAFFISLTLGYKVIETVLAVTMRDRFKRASDLTRKGWIGVFHAPAVMVITISAVFGMETLLSVTVISLVVIPAVVGYQLGKTESKKEKKKDTIQTPPHTVKVPEKPKVLKRAEERGKIKKSEKRRTTPAKRFVTHLLAIVGSVVKKRVSTGLEAIKRVRTIPKHKEKPLVKEEEKAIKLEEVGIGKEEKPKQESQGTKKAVVKKKTEVESLIEEIKPKPGRFKMGIDLGKKKIEEIKPPKKAEPVEKKVEEHREIEVKKEKKEVEQKPDPRVTELRAVLTAVEEKYIKKIEETAEIKEKSEKKTAEPHKNVRKTEKTPTPEQVKRKDYDKTVYERLLSAMKFILVEEWKKELKRVTWRDVRHLRKRAEESLQEIKGDIIEASRKLSRRAGREEIQKVAKEILLEKGLIKGVPITPKENQKKEESKHRRKKGREQPEKEALDLGEEDIASLLGEEDEEEGEEDLLSLLGGGEEGGEEDLEKLLGGE